MDYLPANPFDRSPAPLRSSRRLERLYAQIDAQAELVRKEIEVEADLILHTVQARNGLAAGAAHSDAYLSGMLSLLPAFEESALAYRAALLQNARIANLGDIHGFRQ